MDRKRIKSRPGLFGYTNYYDERGRCVGKSRSGAFGTTVYFDEKGRLVGKSRKGFLAKEVYHDVDFKRHITTYDGILGESHYENGTPIGHTRPGFLGSEYTTLETEDEVSEECFEEDYLAEDLTEDQEGYGDYEDEDLETEAEEYEECTSGSSQYTVVRNLQLFVLCLVICAVIACIYAIVRFN